jgi:shikimate dehydrogenase
MKEKNKIYGLLGRNIDYSFSRGYFTEKFEREDINATYKNFDLEEISTLPALLKNQEVFGLNVTIPYKEEVIPFLDDLDKTARQIGAVNTILFQNGKRIGYNTDCIGFERALKTKLKPHHKKALVLGTGGDSKAVCYVFKQLGIEYQKISRTPGENKKKYDQLDALDYQTHLIIVNCTPLGTFPNIEEKPPIDYSKLNENHFLFDLIYNPSQTSFLSLGDAQGADTSNGLHMLEQQAEAAWELWNQ